MVPIPIFAPDVVSIVPPTPTFSFSVTVRILTCKLSSIKTSLVNVVIPEKLASPLTDRELVTDRSSMVVSA